MTDELAKVKADRDRLQRELNKARAALGVTDALAEAGLPASYLDMAREHLLRRQITTGKNGEALIDYATPSQAAAEFMRERGPELLAASENSLAAQQAAGLHQGARTSSAAAPANARRSGEGAQITRAQWSALSPQAQASKAKDMREGKITLVD